MTSWWPALDLRSALEKAILTARQRLEQSWSSGGRVQIVWAWSGNTTHASTWNGRFPRAWRIASPNAEKWSVSRVLPRSSRRTVKKNVAPGTRLWR